MYMMPMRWGATEPASELKKASSFPRSECVRQPIKGVSQKGDGMGDVSDAEPRTQCEQHFMIDRLGAFHIFSFYYAFLLFIRSSPTTSSRLLIIFINRFRFSTIFPLCCAPPRLSLHTNGSLQFLSLRNYSVNFILECCRVFFSRWKKSEPRR